MAGVFISYRRADSQTWADRLADSLILRFGGGLIWRDVDDIPAGEPWPREIRKALASADAVLVLIGPDWLEDPRLTERRDVLRHEIQTALRSKASVVPVLVGGAGIPDPGALPRAIRSLATLAKRQGVTVRDGWYWRDDVNVLLVELRRIVGNRRHGEPLKRLYEKLGQFQSDYFSVLAKPGQALDVARQTLELLDDQTPHYPHEPILQIVRGYTYRMRRWRFATSMTRPASSKVWGGRRRSSGRCGLKQKFIPPPHTTAWAAWRCCAAACGRGECGLSAR